MLDNNLKPLEDRSHSGNCYISTNEYINTYTEINHTRER